MRFDLAFACALLSSGAAYGQEPGPTPMPMAATGATSAPMHHHHHRHHVHRMSGVPGDTEKPIDKGPDTPDANKAYQGGGVILQGAPGAPAPQPQATPPGQIPANSVPPR